MTDAPSLRIIGIGSPFGDDTIGFQAIELLRQETDLFPSETELLSLDRPGSTLIPLLENGQTVVIIDAMQSGQPAGTVQRLELTDLIAEMDTPSSHSFGVAESLKLAAVLSVMPERLLIYGVEGREGVEAKKWYASLVPLLRGDISPLTTNKRVCSEPA